MVSAEFRTRKRGISGKWWESICSAFHPPATCCWQDQSFGLAKTSCLAFLVDWLVQKVLILTFSITLLHLGSSLQLYSLLLLEIYLCSWCVLISLWMSLLWGFCSSQRLSRGSAKASRIVCVTIINGNMQSVGWIQQEIGMFDLSQGQFILCGLRTLLVVSEPHPMLRASSRLMEFKLTSEEDLSGA